MGELAGVRVVLLDAVGTLLFANPPVADVYLEFGQRFGSALSRERIQTRFAAALTRYRDGGMSDESLEASRWRAIVGEVFDDVAEAQAELFRVLWDHFANPRSWSVFDDVAPSWNELERRGAIIGIASNFDSRLLSLCRGLPPLDRALHLFPSSVVGFAKPRREYFERVQRQLGVSAGEILLVGDDTQADYAGAIAAGWQAVLVDRQGHTSGIPCISNLTQLLDLLPRPAG